MSAWPGVIEAYRERLPVAPGTRVVTLLEGGTPLLPAPELSRRSGCEVWLKVEGANPTGSFKDRGMTVAITQAAAAGSRAVICASTGNTSASAAAYAVRAGLTCAVLVPRGKIALGKLAQALVHGARLLQVDGGFDDCLAVARDLSERYPVTLVNSVNPDRIEGQKTASFEICDVLGAAPDVHCLPVGNAGNITAYWRGYREYERGTAADARLPGRRCGADRDRAAGGPADDDRHRDPDRQPGVLDGRAGGPGRVRRADRRGHRPGDPRRVPAAGPGRGRLRRAGVGGRAWRGCSPRPRTGGWRRARRVVCTVTGNGLKDPDWAIAGAPAPVTVPVDADAAAAALDLA